MVPLYDCPECDGTGEMIYQITTDDSDIEACSKCLGSGQVSADIPEHWKDA